MVCGGLACGEADEPGAGSTFTLNASSEAWSSPEDRLAGCDCAVRWASPSCGCWARTVTEDINAIATSSVRALPIRIRIPSPHKIFVLPHWTGQIVCKA